MQNQARPAVSHLYLNPSSLKISGEKIKLQRFPHEAKPNYNVKQISPTPTQKQPAPPRDLHSKQTTATDCFANRQAYKVSVKNYTNRDVHNHRLKQIYEAIEFHDFKRFLSWNPAAGVRQNVPTADTSEASLSAVKNFYHDNFQVHYNFLKRRQCPAKSGDD